MLADGVEWGYLTPPLSVFVGLPENLDALEIGHLPELGSEVTAPAAFDGMSVNEAFDLSLAVEHSIVEAPLEIDAPPMLDEDVLPDAVDLPLTHMPIQPFSPLVEPPPRPDGFWHSLGFVHDQLGSFDVDDFLSDDVHRQVEHSLQAYEVFLDSIRDGIEHLFGDNVLRMHQIHADYNFYLESLRWDVFNAQAVEHYNLREAVGDFARVQEGNVEDTQGRLTTFASMLPHSRLPTGVNQQLVEFATLCEASHKTGNVKQVIMLSKRHSPL